MNRKTRLSFSGLDRWVRTNWIYLAGFAAVIAFALANGGVAVKTVHEFNSWMRNDAALSGTWTNDGEFEVEDADWQARTTKDTVWLRIEASNGHLSGWIFSPRFCEVSPWTSVRFEGANSWFGAQGVAVDDVFRRRTIFARVDMKLNSDLSMLTMRNLDVNNPFFPAKVTMVKTDERMNYGSICASFMDWVKKHHPHGIHENTK